MGKITSIVVCLAFLSSLLWIPFANANVNNSTIEPTLLWKYTLPTYEITPFWRHSNTTSISKEPFSSPDVANGIVYIGSDGGDSYGHDQGLYAFDADTGAKLWIN
jgi:hypothetical protein